MQRRVVEIAAAGRHVHREHGFLVVDDSANGEEAGRVPLDDIDSLIISGRGASVTRGLLAHLSERNCPVVITNENFLPAAMLISIVGHHLQAKRFDAQISASRPTRKRVWADITRAKIVQQGCVLTATGFPQPRLAQLAKSVKSGDPTNCEAQAARIYWHELFGAGFRRDRNLEGINALLNYGYTVLRASSARAVVSAGLHPTIGVHHRNEGNPMRLVDDLMEPYRPFVDLQVLALVDEGTLHLTPHTKLALAEVLSHDLTNDGASSPIGLCIQRSASSLADLFLGDRASIWLPKPQVPRNLSDQADRRHQTSSKC